VIMDTNHEDTRSFIDEITTGLKGDAELRADVGQELAAHLEDAREAFLAEGKSEEESRELARRSFGTPVEIAEDLVRSNQARMKFRAGVRVLLGRILVPLSLVVAVMVFVHQSRRVAALNAGGTLIGSDWCVWPSDPDALMTIPDEQAFLFHGDTTREKESQQQRAIWERSPTNKVYYANYILHLLNDTRDEPATLEREIRQGQQLDPDNAFYNYLLAAVLFDEGASLDLIEEEGEEERYELEIKDAVLLQRGVAELREAGGKPHYRRYTLDLAGERLGGLPPVKRMEDSIFRIGHLAGILLPDIVLSRNLFRALPYYTEHRSRDGDTENADFLLDAWCDYAEKANQDAFTLIDALVLASIIKSASDRNAVVYESLNKPDDAARTRHFAERLGEPHRQWKERRESLADDEFGAMLMAKGSVLACLLMPAIGETVDPESLRPGRMLDYNLVEQGVFMLIMIDLLVFMFCAALLYGIGRARNRTGGTAMLLLPPPRVFATILAGGILAPILLYLAYSRWSGFGSHEFSLRVHWPLPVAELILLGLTLLASTTMPAARHVANRCRELGVCLPKPARWGLHKFFWVALAVSWVLCAAVAIRHRSLSEMGLTLALSAALGAGFLLVCGYRLIRGLASSPSHGLYYGTLARSLIPIYACAVIFVGGVCLPYLAREETRLLHRDTIIAVGSDRGFSAVETRLVERLQKELREAFEEVER